MERRFTRLPDRLYFFGLLAGLAALPRRPAYRLARRLGRRLERTHPKTREAILGNLRLMPGDEATLDLGSVVQSYFEHVACEDLDAYYYPFWNLRNLGAYFDLAGLAHLDEALSQGRGGILLTGHLGTVCAGMVALGVLGYPVRHVARDYGSDTAIEPAFRQFALLKLRWMESKMGRPLIYAQRGDNPNLASAVLEIKRALSANQLVSMALDVDPAWVNDSVPVRFLGRDCRLTSSLVRLAHECRSPIIPYFNIRQQESGFRHQLKVGPGLELSGRVDQDVQRCAQRLEAVIQQDPAQWFSWDSLSHFEDRKSEPVP